MKSARIIILIAIFILALGDCRSRHKRSSVILISLDTVRQDHLSVYGYFRKTTPFLESLATESVVFTNAYSQISVTTPSHASVFTGHYPSEHKLVANGWKLLDWKLPLLAEALRSEGYQTGAVIASRILGRYHKLDRGFDYYEDRIVERPGKQSASNPDDEEDAKTKKRMAGEVIKFAKEWVSGLNSDKPFFLFLHFYDAHKPYIFPEGWNKPFQNDEAFAKYLEENAYLLKEQYPEVNDYDNTIYYLDQSLQDFFGFLKQKNLLDNALIIIFADHGEGLGQHNFYRHNLYIYEEQMRVPLLLKFPQSAYAGKKISAQVSLIDIAPTIFDFIRIKDPQKASGKSLLPLVRGLQTEIRPCTFIERCWFPKTKSEKETEEIIATGKKAGVVCGQWKLIWSELGDSELFDLGDDPRELKNLKDFAPKKYAELNSILQEHLKKVQFGIVKEQKISEKMQKTLKSLGYAQ